MRCWRGGRFPPRLGERELAQVREAELRMRPSWSSWPRAEVPVDQAFPRRGAVGRELAAAEVEKVRREVALLAAGLAGLAAERTMGACVGRCGAGWRAVLADGNAQGGPGVARVDAAAPDGRHRRPRDGRPGVVVRASGQDLPDLPGTTVVDDPREGKGPVQGIAAGLAALRDQAEAVFVTSTDLPFLHPAFISRVLRALDAPRRAARTSRCRSPAATRSPWPPPTAPASPSSPSASSRRTGCGPRSSSRSAPSPRLDDAALLADPLLAALDPDLDSVLNVNTPEDYQAARQRPAPEVTVQLFGALIKAGQPGGPRTVTGGDGRRGGGRRRPAVRPACDRRAQRRPDHPRPPGTARGRRHRSSCPPKRGADRCASDARRLR